MNINKESKIRCVFALIFTEDILQQHNNFSLKWQSVKYNCQFYLILKEEKDNLNYNITINDQYHIKTIQLR